ncbi:MAG: nodulation protein NfeD [Deltaproteobacteria bacterium]|nr:nodulation protein NfeD [Deltaproteobacteria bacterium]
MIKYFFYLSFLSIMVVINTGFVRAEDAPANPILVIEINSAITPASDDFLKTALKTAVQRHAKALLIKLNTPGGILQSMQSMVEHILQAQIPVIVYVYPSGGGAISAGVFVTLAGHIAAMAPGTTIGAATPVQGTGQNIEGDMKAKVENFAVSLIKAISEQRGRNIEWAEKAVREANSITDKEALEKHVVDIIARDVDDLLKQTEGRSISINGNMVMLTNLKDAPIETIEKTFKQKVLDVLTDPNVLILLGLGAVLGLGIEFYNPGLIFPGLFGAISLILALTAAAVLPINYGGVALLILALVFFGAELFAPSFGLFGIAGVVCLILGSVYLIDSEMIWSASGFTVDKLFIGSIAAIIGFILLMLCYVVVKSLTRRSSTGQEGMLGMRGAVVETFGGPQNEGHISIKGELWRAQLTSAPFSAEKGDLVEVISIEGLLLKVKVINKK